MMASNNDTPIETTPILILRHIPKIKAHSNIISANVAIINSPIISI